MTNNQNAPDKYNRDEDLSKHDKWFSRITGYYFFIGGSLLSVVVLFLIVHTESGRTLASNPVLREFILNTFPNAQLWVYSTLEFKQEIVLIYFYHVLLLCWAWGMIIYLFVFNWKRMVEHQKNCFVRTQAEKNLCTFKTLFKFTFALLFLSGLVFMLGFGMFEPSLTPRDYEDYMHTSGRGLNDYETWNSYIGLVFMFIAKIHLTFFFIIILPIILISMLMCFKKNTFYTPN